MNSKQKLGLVFSVYSLVIIFGFGRASFFALGLPYWFGSFVVLIIAESPSLVWLASGGYKDLPSPPPFPIVEPDPVLPIPDYPLPTGEPPLPHEAQNQEDKKMFQRGFRLGLLAGAKGAVTYAFTVDGQTKVDVDGLTLTVTGTGKQVETEEIQVVE